MIKPLLICAHLTVSPEHPTDWDIPPVSGGSEQQSLGGSTLKDIPWRKYQYVMRWEAMSKEMYEDLEDLVNLHNDFGISIAFQYARWRQTNITVQVGAKLMSQRFAAGCYRGVELVLTEQDPREMVS